jgi:DNA replication protein DnaC
MMDKTEYETEIKRQVICRMQRILPERLWKYKQYLPVLDDNKKAKLIDFLKAKAGIMLICGSSGTGKSCLAAGIISNWIKKNIDKPSVECVFYELAYLMFIKMREYSEMYADCVYDKVGLLVIDEFGASKLSEYELQTIQYIITSRENANKKTVLITNHSIEELSNILQEPLIRRLNENFVLEI